MSKTVSKEQFLKTAGYYSGYMIPAKFKNRWKLFKVESIWGIDVVGYKDPYLLTTVLKTENGICVCNTRNMIDGIKEYSKTTKMLRKSRYDEGNCRLYVLDHNDNEYVIMDEGHLRDKHNLPRFILSTITSSGEPDVPLNVNWVLVNGNENNEGEFITGLEYKENNLFNLVN